MKLSLYKTSLFGMIAVASALLTGAAYAAPTLPCNLAIQNWVNGSGDTCPDFGAGMQRPSPVKIVAVVPRRLVDHLVND